MTTLIMHRRRWRIATHGVLLAAAMLAPAWAQDATTPTNPDGTVTLDTGGVITPAAQAVLDRMTATLNSLRRYAVTARITRDQVLPFGYKLQNMTLRCNPSRSMGSGGAA